MYFNAVIAFAILTFTNVALGAPAKKEADCPAPTVVTVTSYATATPIPGKDYPPPVTPGKGVRTAKAIYFITNAVENSVVSIPIDSTGFLTGEPISTATGGRGLPGVGADGNPVVTDSLFSQDALTVVDDLLFAVNSGSNTLSMFQISAENPTYLTPIGTPQSTLGEFPMSVTFSSTLNIACVVNGGAVNGVTCYSVSRKTGLTSLDTTTRSLGLTLTTPPTGPRSTVSDIHFGTDSRDVIVTVKGNPLLNTTGFLAVYPVNYGVVSNEAIKTSPPGTAVLFGFATINDNTIISTDASLGATILSIDPTSFTASAQYFTRIQNTTAVCWVAYAPRVGSAYVTDVGQNRVVEIDTANGGIAGDLRLTNGNTGMIDTIVGGDFLYALSPSANRTSIAVLDISGGKGALKEVQTYEVKGLKLTGTAMGLHVFPREPGV